MVSVAVLAAVPLMLTGVVVPKLKVGKYSAPDGLFVIAAVSATFPVKPPLGVMVIVDVLPLVAPGAEIVTDEPLTVKLGGSMTVSFRVFEVLAKNCAAP